MKKITLTIFSLSMFIGINAQDITSNLEAHFSFNNGTAAVTSGAVTIDGTVIGATATLDRFGNANAAMSFDGVDDYIDFGDLTNYQFGNTSFTVALWINGNAAQVGQGIPVGKRGFINGEDHAYMFGWKNDGELMTYYRDDNGSGTASSWPLANVPSSSWNHIAMVFDRTANPMYDSVYVYVNGVKDEAQSIVGLTGFNATGTSAGQLMAGRSSNGGQHYNGIIDELYIFRRALSSADINELYNQDNPFASLTENQNKNAVSVYPNPVQSKITIRSKTPTFATITSAEGATLESFEVIGETSVEISSYETGIYFIRTAEGQTVKFIKE